MSLPRHQLEAFSPVMVSPINWVRLRPYSISSLECELQVWFSLHGSSAGSRSLAEACWSQEGYSFSTPSTQQQLLRESSQTPG